MSSSEMIATEAHPASYALGAYIRKALQQQWDAMGEEERSNHRHFEMHMHNNVETQEELVAMIGCGLVPCAILVRVRPELVPRKYLCDHPEEMTAGFCAGDSNQRHCFERRIHCIQTLRRLGLLRADLAEELFVAVGSSSRIKRKSSYVNIRASRNVYGANDHHNMLRFVWLDMIWALWHLELSDRIYYYLLEMDGGITVSTSKRSRNSQKRRSAADSKKHMDTDHRTRVWKWIQSKLSDKSINSWSDLRKSPSYLLYDLIREQCKPESESLSSMQPISLLPFPTTLKEMSTSMSASLMSLHFPINIPEKHALQMLSEKHFRASHYLSLVVIESLIGHEMVENNSKPAPKRSLSCSLSTSIPTFEAEFRNTLSQSNVPARRASTAQVDLSAVDSTAVPTLTSMSNLSPASLLSAFPQYRPEPASPLLNSSSLSWKHDLSEVNESKPLGGNHSNDQDQELLDIPQPQTDNSTTVHVQRYPSFGDAVTIHPYVRRRGHAVEMPATPAPPPAADDSHAVVPTLSIPDPMPAPTGELSDVERGSIIHSHEAGDGPDALIPVSTALESSPSPSLTADEQASNDDFAGDDLKAATTLHNRQSESSFGESIVIHPYIRRNGDIPLPPLPLTMLEAPPLIQESSSNSETAGFPANVANQQPILPFQEAESPSSSSHRFHHQESMDDIEVKEAASEQPVWYSPLPSTSASRSTPTRSSFIATADSPCSEVEHIDQVTRSDGQRQDRIIRADQPSSPAPTLSRSGTEPSGEEIDDQQTPDVRCNNIQCTADATTQTVGPFDYWNGRHDGSDTAMVMNRRVSAPAVLIMRSLSRGLYAESSAARRTTASPRIPFKEKRQQHNMFQMSATPSSTSPSLSEHGNSSKSSSRPAFDDLPANKKAQETSKTSSNTAGVPESSSLPEAWIVDDEPDPIGSSNRYARALSSHGIVKFSSNFTDHCKLNLDKANCIERQQTSHSAGSIQAVMTTMDDALLYEGGKPLHIGYEQVIPHGANVVDIITLAGMIWSIGSLSEHQIAVILEGKHPAFAAAGPIQWGDSGIILLATEPNAIVQQGIMLICLES